MFISLNVGKYALLIFSKPGFSHFSHLLFELALSKTYWWQGLPLNFLKLGLNYNGSLYMAQRQGQTRTQILVSISMSQIKQTYCQICFMPLHWQIHLSVDLKTRVKLLEFHAGTPPCQKLSCIPSQPWLCPVPQRNSKAHRPLGASSTCRNVLQNCPKQLVLGHLSDLGCTCWRKRLSLGE